MSQDKTLYEVRRQQEGWCSDYTLDALSNLFDSLQLLGVEKDASQVSRPSVLAAK